MGLIQKWKEMHYHTKKRIVFLAVVLTIVLGIGGFFGIRAIVKYDPYAKYTAVHEQLEGKYESRDFFLAKGESVYFDLDSQLKNVGFSIKKMKIELRGIDYKNNIITAKQTGTSYLIVTLFDDVKMEKHTITVVAVHVASTYNLIEIRTVQDLVNINENLSGNYILKNNIDIAADFGYWTPLGNWDSPFTGTFVNPDGFKLKNLRIDTNLASDFVYAGLFAGIKGGYIDGLILENVFIDNSNCPDNGAYAGGIAAVLDSYSVIHNCVVQGTIFSKKEAGGIAGGMRDATINGCVFFWLC